MIGRMSSILLVSSTVSQSLIGDPVVSLIHGEESQGLGAFSNRSIFLILYFIFRPILFLVRNRKKKRNISKVPYYIIKTIE